MDPDLRLLLVEDSPEDARLLVRTLESAGLTLSTHRVDEEAALVEALRAPWDLVITDYLMPALTGDRVIAMVRERWPLTAVIVLSGVVGEDRAVEMMRQGASDYILKDNLARVPFAVDRVLVEARGRLARAEAEVQVARLGRMYRILSETNQAIVRILDPGELLHEVCRIASRLGAFGKVRVTQRTDQVLVTAAEAGEGDSPPYFWEKPVFEGGRPLVNNDLTLDGDGRYGTWEAAALYPLKIDQSVWGCLGFYSRTRGFFTAEEVGLLEELAEDLSFGLQARTRDLKRREAEQFLVDLANLVPGLFYKLRWAPGEGLRFLYVSPGIDLLLPLSPVQVQKDPGLVFRTLHPRDRRKFHLTAIRSRNFLTVFNLEFRLLRPNGAVVWVLATAFPQKQADGGVVWTGLAIDVTPQNKLQEALRREQELMAVILNNIGDGVVAVDDQDRLTLVNRTALTLLDKSSVDEVQGPWTSLDPDLPWGSSDRFQPWFRRRTDGTVLHLEAHASDLSDPGAGSQGRVLLLRDMTERDRIGERLRQSEKLESIGLLAGGIAHDFNNLLTGLFGFIQLARMNSHLPDLVVGYLDQALGPFQRARTLTQQLLTFAKGGEPAKVSLRLPELLSPLLTSLFQGSPAAWSLQAAPGTWNVVANEAQAQQVFENLFLNARQALGDRPDGTLAVTLRNRASPGPEGRGLAAGPYLEIDVRDNGPGIPPGDLSRVFDPFFTTKASGTGLGLSICFSVVKKHAGAIEVESIVGEGTLFRVFWPAEATPPEESSG